MSKAIYEKIAKHYAALSDQFEALAAAGAEGTDDAGEEDDVPAPKAAGTKGKAKPAAKKTKPAAAEVDDDLDETGDDAGEDAGEDAPTEQDVIAAAQAVIKFNKGDKAKAIAIIKKHGASRVADLDEDTYPAVIADLKKALVPAKGKAKPATQDDDDI